ncbi:MAG: Holliday junction resolvase Hjc [Candidatus Nanoarchaeia archaeon]|nr:Holliday junction resolvase Hjc [Candidatus Nanoarchaeia archaeon]MDD5587699.1 Holliday junction resolvase Hjc [Candidatus Nanoarchaeia archaeon]
MSKQKGSRAERELLHMLFDESFHVVRSAGSGSIGLPNPDLIAGRDGRILAIECKSLKNTSKYFKEQEIKELKQFSKKFGAEAWLGIRFDNIGWFFIHPDKLNKTKSNYYAISLEELKEKGLNFKELIKK